MYNGTGGVAATGVGATAGVLPFTGVNIVWLVLAAFALIAAGTALLRALPKRRKEKDK